MNVKTAFKPDHERYEGVRPVIVYLLRLSRRRLFRCGPRTRSCRCLAFSAAEDACRLCSLKLPIRRFGLSS